MTKKELRVDYKQKRNLLTADIIEEKSIKIANRIHKLPIWQFSFYHLFLSIVKNKEVDTEPLLTLLQGMDKQIVVSKTEKNRSLKNYLLLDTTPIRISNLGIPEPVDGIEVPEEKIDVVFIPLLAFDSNGNRVGYGGGYYDVFLQKCRKDVLKVGISLFEACPTITDVATTDVPLDYCVTPSQVYQF
ncbi:5-formyltetrahydrofolate cyclo-ligase [Flavobacterium sp. ASW18X]|uniref:5-formyltetrahydrofolate cyclo-ligase n=1 Tax=Flavobacterium sp. ASW18X TaxID=2572595 RepID=UPI0010ADD693|nr:5-formyltetrahydrofolate cyclo-ligase [Flavobacterium sp. ASW18X]TKD65284.1 5-formyltetrahydrofolate cyclo-ligase [Flavobacterium sp. ASW18X]